MTGHRLPEIDGAWLFVPTAHHDDRGFFSRTMDQEWLEEAGIDPTAFSQDSISRTSRGIVRGLHLRRGRGESKLVRCSQGSVFDVVIDLRQDSPTFRTVFTITLTDDPPSTIYVPAGCAHGFQALSDPADISYRIDRPHDPTEDVTIAWDDPDLAVPWPLPAHGMSERDRNAPPLTELTWD